MGKGYFSEWEGTLQQGFPGIISPRGIDETGCGKQI